MWNATNETISFLDQDLEDGDGWIWDDATWILCSSFIIFTMQTGTLVTCKTTLQ